MGNLSFPFVNDNVQYIINWSNKTRFYALLSFLDQHSVWWHALSMSSLSAFSLFFSLLLLAAFDHDHKKKWQSCFFYNQNTNSCSYIVSRKPHSLPMPLPLPQPPPPVLSHCSFLHPLAALLLRQQQEVNKKSTTTRTRSTSAAPILIIVPFSCLFLSSSTAGGCVCFFSQQLQVHFFCFWWC